MSCLTKQLTASICDIDRRVEYLTNAGWTPETGIPLIKRLVNEQRQEYSIKRLT